jgi:hypothetical protein
MNIPIYETAHFSIEAAARPFVDRDEGGHIYIFPKTPVRDRTKLSPTLAIEYMKLSMIVGEALQSAMTQRGVDIGIVNYQDMGIGVFSSLKAPRSICTYSVARRPRRLRNTATRCSPHIERLAFMKALNRSTRKILKQSRER